MNTVEDRLRAALDARAEDFGASPDAWQRIRVRARRRPSVPQAWPTRLAAPLAAAAAVVAIVVLATTLAGNGGQRGGLGGATVSPSATAAPSRTPSPPGRNDAFIRLFPPVTPFTRVEKTSGDQTIWTFFWFGYYAGHKNQGIYLCAETAGQGGCGLAHLKSGQLARVASGAGLAPDTAIQDGVAARGVTSVSAMLADGQAISGLVTSGRGFPDKVWQVGYPMGDAVQLVFRDASGHQVFHLDMPVSDPAMASLSGGSVVFHYQGAGNGAKPGTMKANLINGQVGFWTSDKVSVVSPYLSSGGPALGAWLGYFGQQLEAFGFAHAAAARVVVRLDNGEQFAASTFASGQKAFGDRLFAIRLPQALYHPGTALPDGTATAYDAAGHLLGQVPINAS
jgi:hypothetical protein